MNKPICHVKQVLCYARTSTDEQCLGIEDQRVKAIEWCSERQLPHPIIFEDKISGGADIEKRPGLSALLEAVEKDTLVLVLRRDRLARDGCCWHDRVSHP
jgi:DNA invertase Pin-like site-specific DNA recombinase